jgi:hypothetical protein
MVARLSVVLPFQFALKVGDLLADAEIRVADQVFCVHPPRQSIFLNSGDQMLGVGVQSLAAMSLNETAGIKVDDYPTYACDLLQVDVKRAEFDRSERADRTELVELGFSIINAWLSRVRVIAGVAWVRPLVQSECSWELAYLNDDGSDLERLEGLFRRVRGVFVSSGPVFALKLESWQELNAKAANYIPLTWDTLILDAYRLFPDPGPVVVLAMTAIETRIGTALDVLASKAVPLDVWEWFTSGRRDKTKLPTVQEELDPILNRVAGVSLISNKDLWNSFNELRTARNNFAHQGKATINGKELDREHLGRLVNDAKRIVSWITDLLPPDHKPPVLDVQTKLEITQQIRA